MSPDAANARSVAAADRRPSLLSRLLVLTDRSQAARPLHEVVRAAVSAGARVVVLREKDLPRPRRVELAAELSPLVHDADGLLLTAGEHLAGADGVHLPSSADGVGRFVVRNGAESAPILTTKPIIGRSCHTAAELRAAEADAVDYVTLSPVFPTASKPGYGPSLGPDGLAELVASTTVPVYALGGVEDAEAVADCRRAGAHGVAVMGAIMRSSDPALVVAELLAAAEEEA